MARWAGEDRPSRSHPGDREISVGPWLRACQASGMYSVPLTEPALQLDCLSFGCRISASSFTEYLFFKFQALIPWIKIQLNFKC